MACLLPTLIRQLSIDLAGESQLDGMASADIVGPRGDGWGIVEATRFSREFGPAQVATYDVNMSLTGTYHRTLDEKQRLAVPKRLRDELFQERNPVVFLAPETEQALTLYSTDEFQRRADSLADSLPRQASLRNYRRLYYSQAEQLEVDSQGRIRLPERLVSFAGLTQEVVLLGVHDHVEIWDRNRWQGFLEQHASGFDTLADAAFGADIDGIKSLEERISGEGRSGVSTIPR